MPILHVDIVGDAADYGEHLAQQLADAAGAALASRPQGTWVKLQFIDESMYAENGRAITSDTPDTPDTREGRPIIISLVLSEPATGAALRRQVAGLARAVAEVAEHPLENVHIIVEPPARGRIAFGGKLLE